MNLFILDAGGAGLIFVFAVIFILIAFVVEGLTMWIMKYNKPGKAFLDSLIINLVSLGGGFLLTYISGPLLDLDNTSNFFILYLITVVIEFVVLYLLNRKIPVVKTLVTAIVINLVSYAILFMFQYF